MTETGFKLPGNRRHQHGLCPFCKRHGLYLKGPQNWHMIEPRIQCKYCGQLELVPDVWQEPHLSPAEREQLALARLHERADRLS